MGGFLQYLVGLHQSSLSRSAQGLPSRCSPPFCCYGSLLQHCHQQLFLVLCQLTPLSHFFFLCIYPPTSLYNEKKVTCGYNGHAIKALIMLDEKILLYNLPME